MGGSNSVLDPESPCTCRKWPQRERSADTEPTFRDLDFYMCARRFGADVSPLDVRLRYQARTKLRRPKAPILRLPKDVALRIVLEVASASSCLDSICALSLTCPEFWIQLRDDDHPMWMCHFHALLGAGRFHASSPLSLVEFSNDRLRLSKCGDVWTEACASALRPPHIEDFANSTARQWCLWLLVAARLLRSAFTSCDWLSLSDVGEVLSVAGLRHANAFAFTFLALVAWQNQPPAALALHWLWEIACGRSRPWSDAMKPTTEAMRVDSLRRWLHSNVSSSIMPWNEREMFGVEEVDDLVFQFSEDGLRRNVTCTAAFTLLAVECVAPLPAGPGTIPLTDYASGVEGTLEEGNAHNAWPLMLLLLTRAYRTFGDITKNLTSDFLWGHVDALGNTHGSNTWCGLSYAWRPGSIGAAARGSVDVICFPAFVSDQRWLHSQHGTLRTAGATNDFTQKRVVQLDAKYDAQASCFRGHWTDHETFQSLPTRVYVLDARCGGLLCWIFGGKSPPQDCSCLPSHFASMDYMRAKASDPDAFPEFFGIIGEPSDNFLRCFHLAPPAPIEWPVLPCRSLVD